ncbi:MAG: lipoprotein [Methylophilaceae bacterium]|nr:lipoprotein [Methylophilaceae bacterium]
MKKINLFFAIIAAVVLAGCATNKDAYGNSKLACVGLPCIMPWNKFPDEKQVEPKNVVAPAQTVEVRGENPGSNTNAVQ